LNRRDELQEERFVVLVVINCIAKQIGPDQVRLKLIQHGEDLGPEPPEIREGQRQGLKIEPSVDPRTRVPPRKAL